MIVLGIETATDVCSVGVVSDDRTYHRSMREDRIHSEKVLTLVDEVLKEAGVTVRDLNCIAVSAGPGSFTGLRIGVSTAKGLCFAHGIPLVGVPTFDALIRGARAAGEAEGPAVVAADARQGDWYVAQYDVHGAAAWRGVETLDDVRRRLLPGMALITDRPVAFPGVDAVEMHSFCRGDVVAVLGAESMKSGRTDDVATFEPLYAKEFVSRAAPSRTVKR